ncbi:MAG: hypothetical protein IKO90_00135 [Bacteroidales bacterium]|nr:hypothetical protein [Bacteroidales bacterium]MBR7034384.1 hypothetical protein [Bacteroidales bacterium]
MKKISIYVLVAIIVSAVVSCKKKFGDSEPNHGMLLKFKNEEYANYLSFSYSEEKSMVVGYPSPSDAYSLSSDPNAKCPNGYYIRMGIFNANNHVHDCYTDITVEEYEDIWEVTKDKDIRDTLTSRVIDRDPYEELYDFPESVFYRHLPEGGCSLDIDKINELIESGDFFTYEGVERVK